MNTRDRLNEHLANSCNLVPGEPERALFEAVRFLCAEVDRLSAPAKVSYKLCHADAKVPEYQTAGASGLDLYARSIHVEPYGETDFPFSLAPSTSAILHSGVAISVPPDWELQVRPRSSLSKRQIHACLGTIDSDYRGEIGVILINLGKQPFLIEKGVTASPKLCSLLSGGLSWRRSNSSMRPSVEVKASGAPVNEDCTT